MKIKQVSKLKLLSGESTLNGRVEGRQRFGGSKRCGKNILLNGKSQCKELMWNVTPRFDEQKDAGAFGRPEQGKSG